MTYTKKISKSGPVVRVTHSHRLPPHRYRGHKVRAKAVNPTPEAKKRNNYLRAKEALAGLLECNFDSTCYFVCLSYADTKYDSASPANFVDAKTELTNFLRRMDYLYKKDGYELKRIATIGFHESKTTYRSISRVHHHIVMNCIPGKDMYEIISKKWKLGTVHVERLISGETFDELAAYILKQTSAVRECGYTGQRYFSSKGLIKPEIQYEICDGKWPEEPIIPAGMKLDKNTLFNSYFPSGDPIQKYSLVSISKSNK